MTEREDHANGFEAGQMTPQEAYIARTIEFFDDRALLDWIRDSSCLDEYRADPVVTELLSKNNKKPEQVERVGKMFETLVLKYWGAVDLRSEETHQIAEALFMKKLAIYADEKCQPFELCRMIGPLERMCDFPEWLGDMFNCCDWVEPYTERVDRRDLENEAIRLLGNWKTI